MDWGLLQGLGQGLQNAGNAWTEREKQKLAEELDRQREERAEQRQIAREERQVARAENTVASWRPVQDDDGVLWYQGVNTAGTPKGERRLATKDEIEEHKRNSKKEELTLDALVAEAATKKFKAGRLETEAAQKDQLFELDSQYKRANIGAANALAAQRSSKTSEDTKTERDYVDYVLDKGRSIAGQYTGTRDNPGVLTASEVDDIAARAARMGVAESRDPIAIFKRMLDDAAALKTPTKRKPSDPVVPRFMGEY